MRQLIAGNWKMNGTGAEVEQLAGAIAGAASGHSCELLVCPPATLLHRVAQRIAGHGVALGGQDCHAKSSGAHTGDVSAAMLADAGAAWVILGHSERRADHHETDAMVRAKVLSAVAAGLTPIVCVGETEAQRLAGDQEGIVGGQLDGSLPPQFRGVVAYEPVWAIGTGRTPTEADVAAMHGFIRATLVRLLGPAGAGVRILYGGSVKPANAASLLAVADVGGALIGGAALDAEDFLGIAKASDRIASDALSIGAVGG